MREFAKHAVLLMLRAYKWAISPMFPPACRYVPTCSEYAMEAVERFGALRGGVMAARRVLRCHPLARGGHDPVVGAGCAGAVVVAPLPTGDGARVAGVLRLRRTVLRTIRLRFRMTDLMDDRLN
jgi:putative membrane protein insertion efficiency factor